VVLSMAVADRRRGPVECHAADAAHARHQLDAEESAQAEDGLALTLGVGMQRVGLNHGAVLYPKSGSSMIANGGRIGGFGGDEHSNERSGGSPDG
jgi:hypothetical protein